MTDSTTRTLAAKIEDQITAIEELGQHGRMPGYWREPLTLALASVWIRLVSDPDRESGRKSDEGRDDA